MNGADWIKSYRLGWLRADQIVRVYVELSGVLGDELPWCVKARCLPAVYPQNITMSKHGSAGAADAACEALALALTGAPTE